MKRPIITLLTDFGSADHYAGTMKAVILTTCPEAQIIDISHEVPAYAITEAAFTLAQAWQYFPAGTIHLVVVDPGVGSARRPITAKAGKHQFVAPDNGVLTMVFEATAEPEVREITAARYFRQDVSRTFHGRDLFAPVAADLARGLAAAKVGKRIKDYVRLSAGKPAKTAGRKWQGTILKVDRYGNIITNFDSETWLRIATQRFEVKIADTLVTRIASTYAEMTPEQLFLIPGSSGFLEISIREGSAAAAVGARAGAKVEMKLSNRG